MGFKIKNSLTGEFEKLPILTLKGEKGETGGVEEYNKVDYMGNKYETLKQANDANVEYAVKTAIGEFNYLDYDGQHITATDTIEGRSKSAILKGQTLVNLTKAVYGNGKINKQYANTATIKIELLKPSTKYIAYVFNDGEEDVELYWNSTANFQWKTFVCKSKAMSYSIGASKANFNDNDLVFSVNTSQTLPQSLRCVILEYQDGMENWDIPYFEGMQSVKMPVLTTVGKNLMSSSLRYDVFLENDGLESTFYQDIVSKEFIQVESSTRYAIATFYQGERLEPQNIFICEYDNGKNFIKRFNATSYGVFATDINTKYIKFSIGGAGIPGDIEERKKIFIELEKTEIKPTAYEPYKSNILTVNEDITLRGIGDVQDTLDCLTGEVTQRIKEVVLDGSQQGWDIHPNSNETYTIFYGVGLKEFDDASLSPYNVVWKSDKFLNLGEWNVVKDYEQEYLTFHVTKPLIKLKNTSLSEISANGLNMYLSQNPLRVQYVVKESVKTVALSDNHVYSYKDVTHYDCSSAEGSLVPTLSVKVPTDVQATIAQQRETIQTLNSENERLNQIQEALKASMLNSQVQLMNLSWDTDFEVFALRESIAPKDFLLDSRTGSNIDKFSQAKFIIENDCPDLEKLNSQIEYYFSKDVFSQEQFEELTDLISIVKGGNGCEY